MKLFASIATRRHLLAGLAATLGLTAVAAPTIIAPVAAQPIEGPGPIQPDTISAPGTYESCTAYFGLTKETSNLASFDVINNTTGPDPVIADTEQAGPTLVPVVTLTDANNDVIECTPTPGWTDQTTWEVDYFQLFQLLHMGAVVTYPGTGFWLLPAVGTATLSYFDTQTQTILPFLPVTGTLRFENNLGGIPVSSSMVNLPTANPGFNGDIGLTSEQLLSPTWVAALQLVIDAPTGDVAQGALFDALVEGIVNGPTLCDGSGGLLVPDANFVPLLATLDSLVEPGITMVGCDAFVGMAAGWLFNDILELSKIANAPVIVTVGDPAPVTTTTTTSAAAEPVIPSFAG